MAKYDNLKNAIKQVIKANENNEITGDLLQQSLLAMVGALGDGFQFKGIATPAMNPGTTDNKVFYIAFDNGTYTHFGGFVIKDEVAILQYDSTWHKIATGCAAKSLLDSLIVKVGNIYRLKGDKVDIDRTTDRFDFDNATDSFLQISGAIDFIHEEIGRVEKLVNQGIYRVGLNDRIYKDWAEINQYGMIWVENDARILPTADNKGWLYEYEEGWRVTQTIGDFPLEDETTWADLLNYFDTHSQPLFNEG